jgi:hypothetical protein
MTKNPYAIYYASALVKFGKELGVKFPSKSDRSQKEALLQKILSDPGKIEEIGSRLDLKKLKSGSKGGRRSASSKIQAKVKELEIKLHEHDETIKYILEKFRQLESRVISSSESGNGKYEQIYQKLRRLPKGKEITIDRLLEKLSITKNDLPILKRVVARMVDRDELDIADGPSKIKLQNNIAVITRR